MQHNLWEKRSKMARTTSLIALRHLAAASGRWLGVAALIAFCSPMPASARQGAQAAAARTDAIPASIHPLKAAGLDNFYQLSSRFYSGAAPDGEAAFAELKARGIKTIITVDGAKPDVETAARYGLRYVHLPIGYDGVPTNQAIRLVKAAETLPGPIYIHCHHGMHRGPAGAAVICMAIEGWTAAQADDWLKLAGTSTNYMGLYRSVENFRPPSAEALQKVSDDFPEKSRVSPLADVMIQIDQRLDNLKLIKKAAYQSPPSSPDLEPKNEALLLNELFKELLRSPSIQSRSADFRARLTDAEQASEAFHQILGASPLLPDKADAGFRKLNDACSACHRTYRDPAH